MQRAAIFFAIIAGLNFKHTEIKFRGFCWSIVQKELRFLIVLVNMLALKDDEKAIMNGAFW